MKELVAYLAASLVSRPDEVVVTASEQDNGILLELQVAQEDVTQVIGKHGRTARAMRALVSAAGAKKGGRCFLKILSGDFSEQLASDTATEGSSDGSEQTA